MSVQLLGIKSLEEAGDKKALALNYMKKRNDFECVLLFSGIRLSLLTQSSITSFYSS